MNDSTALHTHCDIFMFAENFPVTTSHTLSVNRLNWSFKRAPERSMRPHAADKLTEQPSTNHNTHLALASAAASRNRSLSFLLICGVGDVSRVLTGDSMVLALNAMASERKHLTEK